IGGRAGGRSGGFGGWAPEGPLRALRTASCEVPARPLAAPGGGSGGRIGVGGPRRAEVVMGQAREVMDRLTAAVTGEPDLKALAELFAEDAVAVTPDEGEVTGRDHIVEYFRQMTDA